MKPYFESQFTKYNSGKICGHKHRTAEAARRCKWHIGAYMRQVWLIDAEPEKDRYADRIDRLIYEDHRVVVSNKVSSRNEGVSRTRFNMYSKVKK